jgi:hypothetical protein
MGKFHGRGIFKWHDARMFEGTFVDGKLGEGYYTWEDGRM